MIQVIFYDFKARYVFLNEIHYFERTEFSGKPDFNNGDFIVIKINPKNSKDIRINIGNPNEVFYAALFFGSMLVFLGCFAFIVKEKR